MTGLHCSHAVFYLVETSSIRQHLTGDTDWTVKGKAKMKTMVECMTSLICGITFTCLFSSLRAFHGKEKCCEWNLYRDGCLQVLRLEVRICRNNSVPWWNCPSKSRVWLEYYYLIQVNYKNILKNKYNYFTYFYHRKSISILFVSICFLSTIYMAHSLHRKTMLSIPFTSWWRCRLMFRLLNELKNKTERKLKSVVKSIV